MNALLDSTVVVDLLRGYKPAIDWLRPQRDLGLTPIVWLEILDGVIDSRARSKALELLRHFPRADLFSEDFDWAIRQNIRFRLSHGIDMMDCLIAAPCHRLRVKLYTCNLKHFSPMLGELAERPY